MSWITDLFGTEKPVIAMCHFRAMPGDPGYDAEGGVGKVLEDARADLHALQNGGVDAIMFSNESSLPYLLQTQRVTSATMSRIIGELHAEITVPYGVNVLWDPMATIDTAVATGAGFVREIFSGVYSSEYGLWNTNAGETSRHKHAIGGAGIRQLYNIVPESAAPLATRDIAQVARSTVFNFQPDALCVSGLTAGTETDASILTAVKGAVGDTPVFANTGVRTTNVAEQLSITDGAVVGTTFKRDGHIWNEVEEQRVADFVAAVREVRGQ